MPAPLVHVAYAKAYLEQHRQLSELEFIRGTAFPDIRKMAKLPRHMTHRYCLRLSDVGQADDAWTAGLLLHSYLDEVWFEIFEEQGVRTDAHDGLFWLAVKQAEEAEFYGPNDENERTAKLFEGEPLQQELDYGVPPEIIKRWNGFMSWKLRTPHTMDDWAHQAERVGYSQEEIAKMLADAQYVRTAPQWQRYFEKLHDVLGIA